MFPCADTYMGTSKGDQKETQAIVNKLESIKKQVKLYLTLHSYGQYMLTPFGYKQGRYPATYQKLVSSQNIMLKNHHIIHAFN